MAGQDIAQEVATALEEVAQEVGAGSFTITLIRFPVDEPTEPWDEPQPGSPQEFTLAAMLDKWMKNEIDGTLIRATDKKVMVTAIAEIPTTDDKMAIGGVEHEIISVEPQAPSGVALFYIVQCRA